MNFVRLLFFLIIKVEMTVNGQLENDQLKLASELYGYNIGVQ